MEDQRSNNTSHRKSNNSQLVIYASPDGNVKVDVLFGDETAWLTQQQMALLFDTTKQNVSLHIKNIFSEMELDQKSVVKESLTTAIDGKKYTMTHYNLDVIISVGYRVKSIRGTQFRIWATQRLREYIIKGFTLDDERLKQNGGRYFDELLERIREIRASERNFYQKLTDLYATAIDYNSQSAISKEFFATVQNKMHYAVIHKTADEEFDTFKREKIKNYESDFDKTVGKYLKKK